MLAISLTSIPPRFARIRPTLDSLLAQEADAVFLCLPREYKRFASLAVPPLPQGVTVLWAERDDGPATKLLAVARALRGQGARVIYCDDDWIYRPGWATALAEVRGDVVAASGFDVARLKRQAERKRGDCDIAQGFGGVAVSPDALDDAVFRVPEEAFTVDDVWLSGHYARLGLRVRLSPRARDLCVPRALGPGLQNDVVFGRDRASANAACVVELTRRFGVWPAASGGLPADG